ncbi:ABC transporter permease [Actinomycetaceae bacterium WB03_NA08]|uniref:ABC transporter permease n=1 Tax=Scrofimicrobium canadense TaxID=2652290 RepID=A0A6N7VS95_9ACTO|nr:ABC transporter permease [Scrofimicrobium canadense]MSS84657.1 ABC transporter permease [Scrofimicrobium canadense]
MFTFSSIKNVTWRIVKRFLSRVLPVVIGVVVAVFFLLRLVPGDPARIILGDQATDASVIALREQLGLDQPVWVQFSHFVTQLFTHFDTGESLVYGESTRTLILERAPLSLGIVAIAVMLTLAIAVPLSVAAASHQDGPVDHMVRVIPAVGMGMPTFWVGLLLIIVFAVNLKWLPVGGIGDGPLQPFLSLVLPGVAVAIAAIPPLVRSLRSELLDVTHADFVTTLRAAHIPERTIQFRHVLRNAAVPTLNLFGVNVAFMIGGTLVVEKVFAINGVGSLLFNAISSRDFPVVQGVALYCAFFVVLITIIVDLCSAAIDPRLRLGSS